MSESKFSCGSSSQGSRDTVLIETNRVLDSCRDRDCYENVRVYLTDFGNEIIEHVSSVRAKHSCISWTNITVDPVQFNRGFYTVNMRFFVKLIFEACIAPGRSQEFEGIAILEKKVILYGSESNVNIFRSSATSDYCTVPESTQCAGNTPTVVVEAVDPIILSAKIVEKLEPNCCCLCCDIPESVVCGLNGTITDASFGNNNRRYLLVSLGLFSVIRMVRPGQYLISATEYNVPDKECVEGEDNDPCGLFRTMDFPISEFNPPDFPHTKHHGDKGRCGCQGN